MGSETQKRQGYYTNVLICKKARKVIKDLTTLNTRIIEEYM